MSQPAILKPCPICGAPADPAHAPFCSRGCKDRDLLQWLGEGYRLPGGPADQDDESGLDTAPDHD
jgi:uncharacterized protein